MLKIKPDGGFRHGQYYFLRVQYRHGLRGLLFADGSTISIDCTAVEDEITYSRFDRSELDWLIYNKPLEYANLVLNGGIEEYCKNSREHQLED